MTAKEFLTKICVRDGYEPSDETMIETVEECGVEVWASSDLDCHRWYNRQETVVEVEGVFIKYYQYIITGDNGMRDMGLEYDLDQFKIVEQKERVVTEVYYD